MKEEQSGKMVETDHGAYYYHPDHLGSSSVVTDKDGKFYESLEYFPFGETWIHNKVSSEQQSTPYKYTSKEQDKETGWYYFGERYLDVRLSRWIAADPPLAKGDYLPKADDLDTDHDYYHHYANDDVSKLPGMGGVYNYINLDAYQYAGQNPVRLKDADGNEVIGFSFSTSLTIGFGRRKQLGIAVDSAHKVYSFNTGNLTLGLSIGLPSGSFFYSSSRTAEEFFNQEYLTLEGDLSFLSGEIGVTNSSRGAEYLLSFGKQIKSKKLSHIFKFLKFFKGGAHFNFIAKATSTTENSEIKSPKKALELLNLLKKGIHSDSNSKTSKIINSSINYYKNKLDEK